MRSALLVALLSLTGCRHLPASKAVSLLTVDSLNLEMPLDGAGALSFQVRCPEALPVTQVEWALMIDGQQIASGLDGAPRVEGTSVWVKVPVVVHHLQWQIGATYSRLQLRGSMLRNGDEGAERFAFESSVERLMTGHFAREPVTP